MNYNIIDNQCWDGKFYVQVSNDGIFTGPDGVYTSCATFGTQEEADEFVCSKISREYLTNMFSLGLSVSTSELTKMDIQYLTLLCQSEEGRKLVSDHILFN